MTVPTFKLGPPPAPSDPRRHDWDALMWKYLLALVSSSSSANGASSVFGIGESETEEYIMIPGQTGPAGASGVRGPAGLDGQDGDDGMRGPQGLQGAQGLQGMMGQSGADGEDGIDGSMRSVGSDPIQAPILQGQAVFTYQNVDAGVTLTVPLGYSMVVAGNYTATGDLIVSGDMLVI